LETRSLQQQQKGKTAGEAGPWETEKGDGTVDWKNNAITDLKDYPYLANSLAALPGEIKTLSLLEEGLRGADAEKLRVQGGGKTREDAVVGCIDKKERLKINYLVTRAKVKRIRLGLEALSEQERLVLQNFYITRPGGHIDRLCEELGYEERNIYNIKDAALRKFTLAMFGVTDL
jgi:hypothetical protein